MTTVPTPAATHIVEVYRTFDRWPEGLLLNIYVCGHAHAVRAAEPYQQAGRFADISPVGPVVADCMVCVHDLVAEAADRAVAAVAALPATVEPQCYCDNNAEACLDCNGHEHAVPGDAEEIARVEEDAAERREHEAEQQAEIDVSPASLDLLTRVAATARGEALPPVDPERTAQLRAEDISADLATDLRNEADSPAGLAAVELLIGVGLHEHPGVVARLITVGRIAADWPVLAHAANHADLGLTDRQWIALQLACSLGAGGEQVKVSLHELLDAVRWLAYADRDALSGLILGAVRIALSPMPAAVTR